MKGAENEKEGGGGCCYGKSRRSKSANGNLHVNNKNAGKNDIFNGTS